MLKKLVKDKKNICIIGTILLVIIVVIILSILFNNNNIIGGFANSDGVRFKEEYEKLNEQQNDEGKIYPKVNISSNNIMKYTSVKEILNIFNNKEDAVIYFGYSTCVYCRNAVQVLCDVADDTELDKIYYLDVEKNDSEKLLNKLDTKFVTKDNEIYAPLVLFISNGKVVSYNKGTLFSQDDPYVELDDSQVEGLSEIYRYGINDVLNSMKINNS